MWNSVLPVAATAGLSLAASASAARLYVSSYAGAITTLELTEGATTNTLEAVAETMDCGENPAWLTIDYTKSFIYCLGEAWGMPTGTITSFSMHQNGSLTALAVADVVAGPVSIAQFGDSGHGLAIASYAGSGFSVVKTTSTGVVELVMNETFTLDSPGPIPDRQDTPHPHQAILDPTSKFILVPDLGADMVRVYEADASTLTLTPSAALEMAPGTGPRHAAFKKGRHGKTFFYVAAELSNTIVGYEVSYGSNNNNNNKKKNETAIDFSYLFSVPTHGDNRTLVDTAAAGEILISPDGKFLIVSSRWERTLECPNFDPSNSTMIASDPLITFAIDEATGSLTKVQEFAAGGSGPRHFSISNDGTRVAVGLQGDGRVAIIERDVRTGMLVDYVATANVEGEVNTVLFYETEEEKKEKKEVEEDARGVKSRSLAGRRGLIY